jgi:hypothetical protein
MLRKLVLGLAVVALSGWILYAAPAPSDPKADADMLTQVRSTLKLLDSNGDKSAASRINLAKVAMTNKAWPAAHEALEAALRLEPNNTEAKNLMLTVTRNMPVEPTPVPHPVPSNPATRPTTKPAGDAFIVKRELTPSELNRIKQIEWKPDEATKMIIRIDPEAKKKFVAGNTDYTLASLSKLSTEEQAKIMLEQGKDDVRDGVVLVKDPASIAEFKKSCKFVIQSCASAGCHAAPGKARPFVLYTPPTNDPAVYTDFLILLKSTFTIKGVERLMVDRSNPESSLVLQFMLTPEIADVPHPPVTGYHPPVKSKADPRYALILTWIQSLAPIAPTYDVDLSKDAPVAASAKQ